MRCKALDGWAITRIPPTQTMYHWSLGREAMNLVSVSDVVLEEDRVDFARGEETSDWSAPLKL